jgi:hypothetical protein
MSTPAPRLEMTDQQIQDLAERTGVRLKVAPAQLRKIMDQHLEDLCRSKSQGAHPPKPDADQ